MLLISSIVYNCSWMVGSPMGICHHTLTDSEGMSTGAGRGHEAEAEVERMLRMEGSSFDF